MNSNTLVSNLKKIKNKTKQILTGQNSIEKPSLWMEQFDENHDFPDFAPPRHQYIICSTPRSGSHFLGHILYSTGSFGYPLEYFNPYNIPHWQLRAGNKDFLEYIKRKRTSPNGCFGMKLHWSHLTNFIKASHNNQQADLTNFSLIFLTRNNKLSQAISAVRAEQTASYISDVPESGELEYDGKLIEKKLLKTIADEASWQYFFAKNDMDFLHVKFEDILSSPGEVVLKIARHVGLKEESFEIDPEYLKHQQSDNTNQEWKARFLKEVSHNYTEVSKTFTI